ncbi:MAG: malate dehydrogenase [Pseudomonadota bacterium]
MKKVSIIGAGNAGTATAFYLAEKMVTNIMLIDNVEGRAKGKALDLMEAAPLRNYDIQVNGSDKFEDMSSSDAIVIAAGTVRKPGMLRSDLIENNLPIVEDVCRQIKKYAPNAVIINLTEPVDTMTYYIVKGSAEKQGFDPKKVLGLTGVLDAARMREFIAEELNIANINISSIVLGGHHDHMVILPRYSRVNGIPISELLPPEKVEKIIEKTKNAGKDIVEALKTGSASYAPGASVAEVVEVIIRDAKQILCSSAYLNGEYKTKNICLGVPVLLGKNGIEKIIELELTSEEQKTFMKSAEVIETANRDLKLNTLQEEV